MFVEPPLFVYSMTDFPPESRNSLNVLSRCSRIPAKVSTAESYASFCTPSADICSKISFFHLFLVTSCTPFVKNLPRVGNSYPRRSLQAPEGASDEGGDLCGLSYPVPPRVFRFFRMHFVVARLTQADKIVCVICKLRMLIRVLDVVHGRRLTAPPIPQAIPAQIAIPPQHSRSQPPPSRRVVIKAHGHASSLQTSASRPPSVVRCLMHTGKPQAYTNARPSSRMYPTRSRLDVGTGDMLFCSSFRFPPELLDQF